MFGKPDDWSQEEVLGSVHRLTQDEIVEELLFDGADPDFAYRYGGDGLRSILELYPVQERIGSGVWVVYSYTAESVSGQFPIQSGAHRDHEIGSRSDKRQKIICSFGLAGTDYYRGETPRGLSRWTQIPNGVVVAHQLDRDVHKRADIHATGFRHLVTIVGPTPNHRPSNRFYRPSFFMPL